MRNNFIKCVYITVSLFFLNLLIPKQELFAQTILNPGDLLILGVNANTGGSPDEISFVCFKDITTGTEIQITDQGYEYCAAGFWGNYEGGAKLTRTGGTITAGTVITFKTNLIAFLFPDVAWSVTDLDPTVLASKLNLNSGGDQIYFAQGGVWTSNGLCNNDYPGSSGRILFGFSTSGAWTSMGNSTKESALYPSASCFNMSPTGKTDFNKYTGPLTAATQSAWIKRVNDPLNWSSYGSSAAYFSASPNLHTKVIPILPGTVADWTAPTSAFCSSDAPVNLNPFITGSPGGAWTGTGVTGNVFNPAGLNGSYDITYTVLTPCPVSQTHQLIVNASPLSPVVTSPVSYCENVAATALSATGTNLLWYTTSSGGTVSSSAPVPSTLVAGSSNYYVSQTVNACESPRAAILVTTIATPALPTVTSPINYCQNATASALGASGTNLLWYTTATNGIGTSTAPTPVTITTGSTTYYVSETVNTCESFRAPIVVNINDTPVVTTQPSTAPQNVCLNGPVNTLSVVANAGSGTITNYQWYITTAANNTGGAAIPFATSASYTPSSSSVGSIYFYCKITNSNGCSTKSNLSGLLKVSASVATPTATATVQPTCNTPTGVIVVTAPAGINIEYSNGGAYQASGTFSGLAAGPYNITARNKISGCISAIKVVTVNALPAGPVVPTASVTVQPDCLTPTATIVVTSPVGITGPAGSALTVTTLMADMQPEILFLAVILYWPAANPEKVPLAW